MLRLILSAVLLIGISSVNGQHDPQFTGSRTTIVHLFEWRWNDVALECERFLGPYGYGGAQLSPANENSIVDGEYVKRPWYERYQPVSYKLETRSGTEEEFKSMVKRCNAVGVRIYIDIVLNHMTNQEIATGVGTGGSAYDAIRLNYEGVPYTIADFNGPADCPTLSGEIDDYSDPTQLRNCRLLGLNDLKQSVPNVRDRIVDFLNKMVGYGVAGFRVDAAKLMWPADLASIWDRVVNLPTSEGFPSGARPFVYQEIISMGGDEEDMIPYFMFGRVTEFKAGVYFGDLFRQWNGQVLRYLRNWGPEWGFIGDNNAVVFVDNHDNQRGHGAGGAGIITYFDSRLYKMATAFSLAWPYAVTRIMSSFEWSGQDADTWVGPPHDANFNILPVTINADMTCGNGWVCEHRWRQIYNMVGFRNVVKGTEMMGWYDGGETGPNQIAFSRGNRGFIAFNNDPIPFVASIPTTLPDGTYCDVFTGDMVNGVCGGRTVTVAGGMASVNIPGNAEDAVIAIHAESKI